MTDQHAETPTRGDGSTRLWWRTRWSDAVWSSDLKALEKLVAFAYADHARAERTAWVTLDRLCERTGLSRDAANRALRGVVAGGYLTVFRKTIKRPTVYALSLPEGSAVQELESIRSTSDVPRPSTGDVPRPESGSTPDDSGSTSPDIGSTRGVPNPRSYPRNNPSPLSRAATIVADALNLNRDDERLESFDKNLTSMGIKNPAAYVRQVLSNDGTGGLEELLTSASSEAVPEPDIREWATRGSRHGKCGECGRYADAHGPGCSRGCVVCHAGPGWHLGYCGEPADGDVSDPVWRRARLEGMSKALWPKCPECRAPQEVTHYDACGSRGWRPEHEVPASSG